MNFTIDYSRWLHTSDASLRRLDLSLHDVYSCRTSFLQKKRCHQRRVAGRRLRRHPGCVAKPFVVATRLPIFEASEQAFGCRVAVEGWGLSLDFGADKDVGVGVAAGLPTRPIKRDGWATPASAVSGRIGIDGGYGFVIG